MFYSIDEDCYLTYPDGDIASRDVIEEMIEDRDSRIQQLLNENEKLKKELEEANKKLYLCTPELPQNTHGNHVSYVDLVNEIYKIETQQQDFMRYLKVIKLASSSETKRNIINEILIKYKEIIQNKEEE